MPIFDTPPYCPQQVPGYPGLWPSGDAGCFDPKVLGATYIVSRDGGALTTNNEGALWRLMWPHKDAGIMHDDRERVAAVSGLCEVKCALKARRDAHPLAVGHPLPFTPYKFILDNLPTAEEEGLNPTPHAIVSKTSTRNSKPATHSLKHGCVLQGILEQNTVLGPCGRAMGTLSRETYFSFI